MMSPLARELHDFRNTLAPHDAFYPGPFNNLGVFTGKAPGENDSGATNPTVLGIVELDGQTQSHGPRPIAHPGVVSPGV